MHGAQIRLFCSLLVLGLGPSGLENMGKHCPRQPHHQQGKETIINNQGGQWGFQYY